MPPAPDPYDTGGRGLLLVGHLATRWEVLDRPPGGKTVRASPVPSPATPATPFAHLGLAEPETLADVREGQVCAPCEGQLNMLEVAVHPLDGARSQVYLRGVD